MTSAPGAGVLPVGRKEVNLENIDGCPDGSIYSGLHNC